MRACLIYSLRRPPISSILNSISNPKDVKNTYLVMTIMTKLGGALFAGFAWFFLTNYSLFFSI